MASKIAGSIGKSSQDGPTSPPGVGAVHDASEVKAVLVNKVAVKRQDTKPTSEPTTTPATTPPKDAAPAKKLGVASSKQGDTTTTPATTPSKTGAPAKTNTRHVENTEDKSSKSLALGSSSDQESSTSGPVTTVHQAQGQSRGGIPEIIAAPVVAGRHSFVGRVDDMPMVHVLEKRGQGKNGVTRVKKRG